MSTLFLIGTSILVITPSFANNTSGDKFNIAGTYNCSTYGSHDGFFHIKRTLKFDKDASDPAHNFLVYTGTSEGRSDGKKYKLYFVANGSAIAASFENPADRSDYGVMLGSVSYETNSRGESVTKISSQAYQPDYQRTQKGPATGQVGGKLSTVCIKLS